MSDSDEARLTRLETTRDFMAKEITDIKTSVGKIEERLSSLERKIAYWTGGAMVAFTIIQFIIEKFLK